MIITRTPYRLSLFGGGTDYPAWYREHGGEAIAAALNRYCYLTCRYLPPFFEHRSRIVYSRVEYVKRNAEIEHPAVRAVLAHLHIEAGVEVHHDGDLPARTGIGSSSAFTVGLLHALHTLCGRSCSATQLAQEAITIEQDVLKEAVGCQDQIVAALGGVLDMRFERDGAWQAGPLTAPAARLAALESHLMLFHTGQTRTASDIAQLQLNRLDEIAPAIRDIQALVPEARAALCGHGPIGDVGRLLHASWEIKRSLTAHVTTADIDAIYERARTAGALGGKLMGAGGGGFLVLLVEPDRQQDVRSALAGLLEVPCGFDHRGSQVVAFETPVVS